MPKNSLDPRTDYAAPRKQIPFEDVEYNLARLEGQLARIEYWNEHDGNWRELVEITDKAKDFLKSLRLALDPHRIDVA